MFNKSLSSLEKYWWTFLSVPPFVTWNFVKLVFILSLFNISKLSTSRDSVLQMILTLSILSKRSLTLGKAFFFFYPCHTLLLSCNLPNKHGIYKQLVPNVDQKDVLEYLLGTEQILQKLVLPQILYHLVEFLCSS